MSYIVQQYPEPRRTRTVTTTREFDDAGKLVKEVVVEETTEVVDAVPMPNPAPYYVPQPEPLRWWQPGGSPSCVTVNASDTTTNVIVAGARFVGRKDEEPPDVGVPAVV